jgi:hypothetical protein
MSQYHHNHHLRYGIKYSILHLYFQCGSCG